MDKLPLRQTVIASAFFAAARTDAFTSLARFDFDFYSLSFGLGQADVTIDKMRVLFFQIQNSFNVQLHGDRRG